MTGTADTEAEEFDKIYKLDVMVIPTNRALMRIEEPDTVYRTEREKYDAIVDDIIEKQAAGPPGAGRHGLDREVRAAVDAAEARGIKHVVLNAKYHAQEAEIVAQAGRKGTVTIATNMAGRGTDILLGGNAEYMARQQALGRGSRREAAQGRGEVRRRRRVRLLLPPRQLLPRAARATTSASSTHFKQQTDAEHDEVVGLGGLHIIGTERHEARRIDNQLRGRAGRQGDPGLVALLPVARRRPDAHLRVRSHLRADAAARHGRRRADRARHGDRARSSARRSRSKRRTSPSASTCSSTTT